MLYSMLIIISNFRFSLLPDLVALQRVNLVPEADVANISLC
ncbi:hypothetical protein ROSI111154_12950 [Rouxiella silvae]